MHVLSPETDNCPSWISGRERMTVENISWSISTKECCRPRRGLNPRPPRLQSDGASNWATEAGYRYERKMIIAPSKRGIQTHFLFLHENIALHMLSFIKKLLIFFLFLHKKHMLWVLIRSASLEVQGASNGYHNICFHGEIRKKITRFPLLSRPMMKTYIMDNH